MIAIRQASSVNPKYLDAEKAAVGGAGRAISAAIGSAIHLEFNQQLLDAS
jgi:hypothetical protein